MCTILPCTVLLQVGVVQREHRPGASEPVVAAEPETEWKDASKRIGVVAYDSPLNRSAVPLPKACGSASQTPMRLTARNRATGNVLIGETATQCSSRSDPWTFFAAAGFPKLVAIIKGFLPAADPTSISSTIPASESRTCRAEISKAIGIKSLLWKPLSHKTQKSRVFSSILPLSSERNRFQKYLA